MPLQTAYVVYDPFQANRDLAEKRLTDWKEHQRACTALCAQAGRLNAEARVPGTNQTLAQWYASMQPYPFSPFTLCVLHRSKLRADGKPEHRWLNLDERGYAGALGHADTAMDGQWRAASPAEVLECHARDQADAVAARTLAATDAANKAGLAPVRVLAEQMSEILNEKTKGKRP